MASYDEIDLRIEKVQDAVLNGRPEPEVAGRVDPYDVREHSRDVVGKVSGNRTDDRKDDVWRQVMQSHDFNWYAPKQLDEHPMVGPEKYIPKELDGVTDARGMPVENANLYWTRAHRVGQWRRDRPHWLPMAYTMDDLWTLFRSPEAFDTWITRYEMEKRAARMGVVLAGRR
jgi:hypothetical protein